MRIALVCRELYPLGGGGIGQFVSAAARLLAEAAEVTVLTSSVHRPDVRAAAGRATTRACRLPGCGWSSSRSQLEKETGSYFSVMHLYSARV